MSTRNVATLSAEEKIGEAIKRSLRLLPGDVARQLEAMLSPASLAAMCAAIVAWAVSHAFGVGEVTDLALLAIGLGFCGWGIFDGFRDLAHFAGEAMRARSDQDLDRAAGYFASAVTKIGVNTLMALLFRKPIRSFREMGGPGNLNFRPNLVRVEPPPPPGVKPTVVLGELDTGVYGVTDPYGNITINWKLTAEEQRLTIDHESVHSFLSPKFGPLRQIRARLAMSGYARSSLLKYLEEAMAETYAQVRARGMKGTIAGITFPIENGYLCIEEIQVAQGIFLGVIVVDGHMLHVTLAHDRPGRQQGLAAGAAVSSPVP
jgi:hypothetical protein